jgi:Big-like domain-containing protein/PKD domain-containing protein/Calx-beta domain-containing protein
MDPTDNSSAKCDDLSNRAELITSGRRRIQRTAAFLPLVFFVLSAEALAQPGVSITQSGGSTDVDETGPTSDTYTLVLDALPTANVDIVTDPDGQSDLGAGAGVGLLLTFTAANWNVAQTITVIAVDDSSLEGAHTSTITHTATSGDGNYNGISIANVVANVTDNDSAGVTVTETGGATGVDETGPTSDSYTVVLNSKPSANVTITVDPDVETDLGLGAGASVDVTFAPSSWSIPRTVIVTAVDDADAEGPHTSTLTQTSVSADTDYNGITIPDIVVTVVDNDTAGVNIGETGGTTDVNESGATSDTYTIILTNTPTDDVTITVDPDAQTNLGSGPGTAIVLVFTTIDWNVARNMTVTAVDDLTAEGPHTSTITHTAVSTDGSYNGITISNVVANVTDNDQPGVTIAESGGSTDVSEVGPTSDTYTIVLDAPPTANVDVTVTPDTQTNLGAGAGTAITLTFTTGNWNVAQTATVTAVDDTSDEGAHTSTITHTASSADSSYNGITVSSVTANVTDNDAAAVSITESGGTTNVDENGPTSDTYTIALESQPTATVSVTIDPDNETDVGSGAGVAVVLSFTTGNWNIPQTVTVTATDDFVVEGAHTSTITHSASSSDTNYNGITINNVVANVTDNDAPGVTISETNGSTDIAETGPTSDNYTIALDTQPASNVTVTIDPDGQTDLGSGAGVAIQEVFTSVNWNTPRTVSVTAVDDGTPEGPHTSTITHSAASADSDYNGITISNVVANISDNDTAGVTILESGASTDVSEAGTTDTYDVVLNTAPTNNVTVTVDPDTETDVGAGAGATIVLTFTTGNWSATQTVTVTAIDDSIDEGVHTSTITHTSASADGNYNGVSVNNVSANITDNDTAAVSITESGGSTDVDESGPTSDTFTVVLGSQPTAAVSVTVDPDDETSVGSGTGVAIVLSFTTGNWNSAQTVTVTAVDDAIDEGSHTSTITFASASADTNYSGFVITNLTANITDNDTAGVTVTESGSTDVDETGPTSDSYTIVLDSEPTGNVTITVDPDVETDLGSGAGSPVTLVFTSGNWNTPKTVNVTAVDDAVDEGMHTSTITHASASADTNYNGVSINNVTANVTDNDTAGVTVTQSAGSSDVDESGPTSDTYTIVLDSEPTANVTITVDPDSQTDVGSGAGVAVGLTFTTGNWSTTQTVTVTAVDDSVVEGAHSSTITHTGTSADAKYNGIGISAVSASVADNDSEGVTIVESAGSTDVSENGPTSDTYTIVLASQPTSSVGVAVDPDSQTYVGAGPAATIFVTFSTGNWNTPQTVTVTAVSDGIPEGSHSSTITHVATSSDGNYNGFTIPNTVANVGDSPTVTVVESGGTTVIGEDGPLSDTYTIVLRSLPTANVTVFVDPDPQSDVGAGPGTAILLLFTSANWSVAQTVTVTAVNDVVVEGAHFSTIAHYAISGDSDYNGITISDVVASVSDNDSSPNLGGGGGGSGGSQFPTLVADSQSVLIDEDSEIEIILSASGVGAAVAEFFILSGPSNGALVGDAPNLTYIPETNFAGLDSFTFVAVGDQVASISGIVDIEVAPVNDSPSGRTQDLTVRHGSRVSITLRGSDPDDGDTLEFEILDSPGFGSLTGTPPRLTYRPDSDFSGLDSFLFVVTDGAISSQPVTVTIRVLDPPETEPEDQLDPPILIAEAGEDVETRIDQIVTFDGSGSRLEPSEATSAILDEIAATNQIVHYAWNFDDTDGFDEDTSGMIVEWSYDTPGTYMVTLTVTDDLGSQDQDTLSCTVLDDAPEPGPDAPESGPVEGCGAGLCGLGVPTVLPFMFLALHRTRSRNTLLDLDAISH